MRSGGAVPPPGAHPKLGSLTCFIGRWSLPSSPWWRASSVLVGWPRPLPAWREFCSSSSLLFSSLPSSPRSSKARPDKVPPRRSSARAGFLLLQKKRPQTGGGRPRAFGSFECSGGRGGWVAGLERTQQRRMVMKSSAPRMLVKSGASTQISCRDDALFNRRTMSVHRGLGGEGTGRARRLDLPGQAESRPTDRRS